MLQRKWKEESREGFARKKEPDYSFSAEKLRMEFPEIYDLNYIGGFLNLSIIAIDKIKNNNLQELAKKLINHESFKEKAI
ncbi:MAG: hypothetical protein MZV63_39760 [Marinilabiliales bacterium]|nr:hypothetical protein [Marinilabiliales bacterium]